MKALDFCVKFNDKVSRAIVTSIIECAHEMLEHGFKNPDFKWDNGKDNACTLFDFDIYESQNGPIMPFEDGTNVVITITELKIIDDLQFSVIDIFNDRIELCDQVNGDAICIIPLNKSTEVDEGYVFQLQTEYPVMPFSVQDLLVLQDMGSMLDDDQSE